jgi:predicted DNA-binding transcriptional regulator AlpA
MGRRAAKQPQTRAATRAALSDERVLFLAVAESVIRFQMNAEELAALTGTSIRTIATFMKERRIPPSRRVRAGFAAFARNAERAKVRTELTLPPSPSLLPDFDDGEG